MDRAIMKDPEVDALFKEQGYILPPFIFSDEIREFKNEIAPLSPDVDKRFYSSTDAKDFTYREKINNAIRKFYNKIKDTLPLINYSYYYGTLIIKESGTESEVIMHTDWSITDEELFTPVTIWIPLIDTNMENGCVGMVKGSHKYTNPHRGVRVEEYYKEFFPALKERALTYLPMKAGQPVIYHNGLIHYSPPNLSGETRQALLIALYPSEATPVFYFEYPWSKYLGIAEYYLKDDFFNHYDKWTRPKTLKFKRLVRNKNKKMPLDQFLKAE